jgi:hypothetical protein
MKEHTINLIDLAHMAVENMRKEKEFVEGVKYAIECFRENKVYYGSYIACAWYINNKISIASLNTTNNPKMLGAIALYGAMADILFSLARKEKEE